MADKRPETDSADNDNPAAEELQPENTQDLGPEQAETGDEGDTSSLAEALEAANEQIAALKDQALRGQADAENARRRAARDVENAHKFALEKLSKALNLRRMARLPRPSPKGFSCR
jgi:molecular chaperone GrpE